MLIWNFLNVWYLNRAIYFILFFLINRQLRENPGSPSRRFIFLTLLTRTFRLSRARCLRDNAVACGRCVSHDRATYHRACWLRGVVGQTVDSDPNNAPTAYQDRESNGLEPKQCSTSNRTRALAHKRTPRSTSLSLCQCYPSDYTEP